MKKTYQEMHLEVVLFAQEDIVRTSNNDNVGEMPEFPENFEG
jgi:hypothetical protein